MNSRFNALYGLEEFEEENIREDDNGPRPMGEEYEKELPNKGAQKENIKKKKNTHQKKRGKLRRSTRVINEDAGKKEKKRERR